MIDVEYLSTVLKYNAGGLYWKVRPAPRVQVGDRVGYITSDGYRHFEHLGVSYKEHRVIWSMFNGQIPEGYEIDHINRIKHDNRTGNLRAVTHKENCNNLNQRWTETMERDFQELLRKRNLYHSENGVV